MHKTSTTTRPKRALAATSTSLVTIALGLSACGAHTHTGDTHAHAVGAHPRSGAESAPRANPASGIEAYGDPATAAQHAAIATALHGYDRALVADDGGRACAYLSSTLQLQVRDLLGKGAQRGHADCAGVLSQTYARAIPRAQARLSDESEITTVRVSGSQAFAFLSQPNAPPAFFPLQLEGGKWKLAALQSTVVPQSGG